jgi:hypothetical protein
MGLSSISPEAVVASQQALTRQTAGIMVMRKALDIEASQGAMLIQMLNQSAGLGGNVDISV